MLRCDLPEWREPAAFALLDRSVQPKPGAAGVLKVSASFRNDARWAQPWPTLRLSLSDIDGREAGARAFAPAEYRRGHAATDVLAPGQSALVEFDVIPGITSVQALAAQHKVPLNRIGRSFEITTGRRLAAGQVSDADSLVVMLDAEDSYHQVADQETEIYWGAYLGTPDEILISGKLEEVAQQIERVRKAARQANGWIMDTYLLRKP